MADVVTVGVNLDAFSHAISGIQALRSSVSRVFESLKDGMKNRETLEGREKQFIAEFQDNLQAVNRDLKYVDDVISRIGRMFPDMTIELFRPNGTSAVLLVTLGKVLKAIVVMRSLFIDRTVVRGFSENVYNEDGKVKYHRQSPDLRPQTSDLRAQTSEPRPQTSEPRPQSPDLRAQTPDLRRQTSDPRPQSPDLRPQSPDLRAQTPDLRPQTSDPRPQSPDLRAQTPDLRPQSPDLRAQTPDLRPQTSEPRPQTSEPRPQSPNLEQTRARRTELSPTHYWKRITQSCSTLRQLVPTIHGVHVDMVTVLETTVAFLKTVQEVVQAEDPKLQLCPPAETVADWLLQSQESRECGHKMAAKKEKKEPSSFLFVFQLCDIIILVAMVTRPVQGPVMTLVLYH
ncbi:Mediator of RNA polymerase II transcription subunit 27 [Collichthys lucidus]|uniref:Mediator of RNA polymerase II transcription subunit 27 n=1 Tax=Collichthys lucidus TaxID=240159 RepID=A0A4U5UVV6_COLLU|nr:Mediator of RNA polymerase II transcription subunit 27 [Collichthys lucidus]